MKSCDLVILLFFCPYVGAPPTPSHFKATERTPNSVTVQWDRPTLGGVTYKLQYRENSNQPWTEKVLQNGESSYAVNNLKSNTSYTLRIIAIRNSIQSLPTDPLTVQTRVSGNKKYCIVVIVLTSHLHKVH